MVETILENYSEKVPIGVIGGTGMYHLEGFEIVARVYPSTPWGKPSAPITIARAPKGTLIGFLARHGHHHTFTPSEVPNRANIASLKHLGCNVVIAFSAVGSLKEEIKPRDFVLPNQIIDRTRGFRPDTFFERNLVGHVMFADPFDNQLQNIIKKSAASLGNQGVCLHTTETSNDSDQVLVCIEGPAFSTRAESRLYRSWGGAVVNMSALPEAKLAVEAEIQYAMICMATDYDCWKEDGHTVTVELVTSHLRANAAAAKHLIFEVLETLEDEVKHGSIGTALAGSRNSAICTASDSIDPIVKTKLDYLQCNHW